MRHVFTYVLYQDHYKNVKYEEAEILKLLHCTPYYDVIYYECYHNATAFIMKMSKIIISQTIKS